MCVWGGAYTARMLKRCRTFSLLLCSVFLLSAFPQQGVDPTPTECWEQYNVCMQDCFNQRVRNYKTCRDDHCSWWSGCDQEELSDCISDARETMDACQEACVAIRDLCLAGNN